MTINVKIEAHAYAAEELVDEYFNAGPHFGIAGPSEMEPLSRIRGKIIQIDYTDTSTIGEIREKIEYQVWNNSAKRAANFSFLANGDRYYITKPEASFSLLKSKYLDPQETNTITACFLVSHDAGAVGPQSGPLRFFFPSHEDNRHIPHVHVRDTGFNFKASINILDGSVIVGKIPPRFAKKAREEVLKNKEFYIAEWAKQTDGMAIDINHHFGYIGY